MHHSRVRSSDADIGSNRIDIDKWERAMLQYFRKEKSAGSHKTMKGFETVFLSS